MFSGVRMLSPGLGAWVIGRLGYSAIGGCAALLTGGLVLAVNLGMISMQPPVKQAGDGGADADAVVAAAAAAPGRAKAE